jgi:copper transport protein
MSIGAIASTTGMGITAPITTPLAAGRYSIVWRTAASDGHASSGRFSFVFAPTATPPSDVSAPPTNAKRDTSSTKPISHEIVASGGESGYSIPVRWAELVAVLTIIGAVVFRLFVLPRAEWPAIAVADAADRARRLAGAVLFLFVIASVMRLVAESDLMPGASGARSSAILSMVQDTSWGHGWFMGAAGALVVLAGLIGSRTAASGWIVAGVGAVALCVGEALTGHAGSIVGHAPLGIAADVAHFLGAGGWLGGLACVVLCGLPALRVLDVPFRDVAGSRLARAYHRAATESVVVVVASALIAAWLRLNALSDLWTTAYGSMLFRKIIFVLILMCLGAYHWRKTVIPDWTATTARRFKLTATAELVVGAVVIAFTALLVSTALPPHS